MGISGELLKVALQSVKVLVWRYDYKHNRITDSGSLGEAYHLPKVIENIPECLIEANFIHEDSIEDFREMFQRIKEEKLVTVDVRAVADTRKGYVWDRLTYTPIFDREGNYVEAIGTSIDITEQKERERSYEEQFRAKRIMITNAKMIGLFNLTRNTISDTEVNDPELEICVLPESADDSMEIFCQNFIVPEERQKYLAVFGREKMLENFSNGITHAQVRHHTYDYSGWLESSYELVENPYTGDMEAIVVLTDISELVRAEQVVNAIMQIDYEAIMTINAETGMPYPIVGGKAEDIMKEQAAVKDNVLGIESYIRKHCVDIDVERVVRETSLSYVKERLEGSLSYATSYTLNVGGNLIHKRVIYAYLNDAKKTLLCAVQDLTEMYKQDEAQKRLLHEALRDAEQANSAKTEFFSRMSHDMRTPMNGILGLAELSEQERDVDILIQNMRRIKESGQYLLSLINDTLDFQRIESGKMVLEPQVVGCREIMQSIVDMVTSTARAKRLELKHINRNIDMDSYIRIDPVRMKQIFINLLSNAIKFTPEGGTISVEYECMERIGMISRNRIYIHDTGIGMSKDFLEHGIFKPFSQEYNGVTSQYAGTGLGLSIARSLVELMGGTISVESEQGIGTTFIVIMDFERVDPAAAVQTSDKQKQQQTAVAEQLCGKRILLAEDHPLNAEITRKLLERAGCYVVWAKDGKECVELFASSGIHEFDAILMDIRMPRMDGLQAAEIIRKLDREEAGTIPIIAMTANAYDEDREKSMEAGMNAHLAKPVMPQKVYEALAKYIGG